MKCFSLLHAALAKNVNAYTYVFLLIIVDDEGELNFKDAEWCKQNLADTLHEQTESEPESNKSRTSKEENGTIQ